MRSAFYAVGLLAAFLAGFVASDRSQPAPMSYWTFERHDRSDDAG